MYRVKIRSIDGTEHTDHADFFDAVAAYAEATGLSTTKVREDWCRCDGVLTFDDGTGEYYVDLIPPN